jgi:AraC-like DNA-binding protein
MADYPTNSEGWIGISVIQHLQVAAISTDAREAEASVDRALRALLEIPQSHIALHEFVVLRGAIVAFVCGLVRNEISVCLFVRVIRRLAQADVANISEAFKASIVFFREHQQDEWGEPDYRVKRALGLIHHNYAHRLTVDGVAASLKISRWHLERLLKRWTGLSFTAHVCSARMDAASDFLSNTDMSVKEVGAKVGYSNRGPFARDFRRRFGTTPKAWAVAQRRGAGL